jgi:hypothetical protein
MAMPSLQAKVHRKHDYLCNRVFVTPNRHKQPSKQNHHAIILWPLAIIGGVRASSRNSNMPNATNPSNDGLSIIHTSHGTDQSVVLYLQQSTYDATIYIIAVNSAPIKFIKES